MLIAIAISEIKAFQNSERIYRTNTRGEGRTLDRAGLPPWAVALYAKPSGLPARRLMAGVWTSVCVMFPALDAKATGYNVYAVMDASGNPSKMASRTTLARFIQASVVPTTANSVLSEVHRTWNRPEAAEIAKLYTIVAPNYGALIESYIKAQEVARQPKK